MMLRIISRHDDYENLISFHKDLKNFVEKIFNKLIED